MICAQCIFLAEIVAYALANGSEDWRSMRSRVRLFRNLDGADELVKQRDGCKATDPDAWTETHRVDLNHRAKGFPAAKGKLLLTDLIPRDSLMRFPEAIGGNDSGSSGCDPVADPI